MSPKIEMNRKKYIPDFKLPENYFNDFEDELFLKIDEESFPKTSGFGVPYAYFTKLENSVFDKLRRKKNSRVIRLIPQKALFYASAVASCLIIGFSIFSSSQSHSNPEKIHLSVIDRYIEDGNLDMDLYDVTHYLRNLEDFDLDIENFLISDEAIEEYLFENPEDNFSLFGSAD